MYSTTHRDVVISHGHSTTPLLQFDRANWETFTDEDVVAHFDNIHAMLIDRIGMIGNKLHYVTEAEDKELQFMLETVLHAKRYVQDRHRKS